ncbi:MAG: LPP20 family lipoprotein [Fibromonadales bacterium]|nr:LPP20 family lipoprotein [Fibromonadales bacterium]
MFKFLFITLIIIGCASSPPPSLPPPPAPSLGESLASAKCASDEFRGFGTGTSEEEALSNARSALARQIQSTVKVSEKYTQNQKLFDNNEHLSSEYVAKTTVESVLSNAHDARELRIEHRTGEVGAVVCMSRADVAKSFAERQRLVTDSLELVSRILPSIKHPKQKNEAWHKTQVLWSEFVRLQGILDGFGAANAELFESVSKAYSKTREDYKNYCQTQKVYWSDQENEYSKIVFAKISEKVAMEKSACSAGLNLRFTGLEKCANSSFGVECSFEPSLSVESCAGESYSLLKSKDAIAGYDMHNKNKAKENLIAKLQSAAFLDEWLKEIKEWTPQCVE